MSTNAENTIDLSIFKTRELLKPLVPNFSGTKQRKDGWFVDRNGEKVWSYAEARGALAIRLAKPLTAGDLASKSAYYEEAPEDKKISGVCALFTRTTKMNCYSWNLPAGPVIRDGACPGARIGFMTSDVDRDPARAIDASKAFASSDLYDTVPSRSEDAIRRFLCNGCYALKANYAYTSVIFNQLVKMAWLEQHALPEKTFVRVMVEAITAIHEKNLKEPVPTNLYERAEWAHPDFFRIHDAGDFFSPEYFDAWLSICRRLPDMHFWAPTRIWVDQEMGQHLLAAVRGGRIPPNLSLRPSGLFFDGPQPRIRGLAGGASSTNFTFVDTRKGGVEVTINHAGKEAWGCPAYFPNIMGGGALPAKKKAVKQNPVPSKQILRKMPEVTSGEEDEIFYDAVVDNTGEYVLDPRSGKPMTVNAAGDWRFDANWRVTGPRGKGERKQVVPPENIKAAQKYQPAGCCSIALDPLGNEECRLCWGVSGQQRDKGIKQLPVVYAEH